MAVLDLAESTKIHLAQAGLWNGHVAIAGPEYVVQPQHRMEQRRFSRAVRAEYQRDGADRDRLKVCPEGFEIGDADGF